MNVRIYCFKKGLFIKQRYIHALKTELISEFDEVHQPDKQYLVFNTLTIRVHKDYDTYFTVYERADELNILLNVLRKVSVKYNLNLYCEVRNNDERILASYIQDKVKKYDITMNIIGKGYIDYTKFESMQINDQIDAINNMLNILNTSITTSDVY